MKVCGLLVVVVQWCVVMIIVGHSHGQVGRRMLTVSWLLGIGWLLVGCCCCCQRWRNGDLRVLVLVEVGGVRVGAMELGVLPLAVMDWRCCCVGVCVDVIR